MKKHQFWDIRFFQQILDTMADGLFTVDSQGAITSWNRAMERITGYTAEQAVGANCQLLKCSRCFGRQCGGGNDCEVLKKGNSDAKECHVRHKEGYDVPVIKSARAVRDDDNALLGIVETLTDLTELTRMRRKAEEAQRQLTEAHRLGNIIGKSPAMKRVFDAIGAAAESRATVLIQGESGTGKELVAAAIHYNSPIAEGPFVTVNCSALSETLLESELFGHVKGAFTDAYRERIGRFEQAHNGTIFLDEIGELTPYMQVKLLRVIQEREIERVGDSRKIPIDIRILAATHQNLMEQVHQGRFREDLFYRLKVFPIPVPPLRERRQDIPLLVRHFIDKGNQREQRDIAGVSRDAMDRLMSHPWPGNVRELENAMEHAFVLCRSSEIDVRDLPAEIREPQACTDPGPAVDHRISSAGGNPTAPTPVYPTGTTGGHPGIPVSRLTRSYLLQLLHESDWNKAEVGRRIGKSRTSVWKYMKKWDIPMQKPGARTGLA